jgi:acyl dehydratase
MGHYLTHNTNQLHFNEDYAGQQEPYGRVLVNSVFTLALVTGLSVPDTSEGAIANLGWDRVRLPNPVFVGDTLHACTTIVDKRLSRSGRGIVTVHTEGVNQRGQTVIEFSRSFMMATPDNRREK